ncbi:MAG: hypothetical protein ACO25F_10675 [Erythrobacter sp.]
MKVAVISGFPLLMDFPNPSTHEITDPLQLGEQYCDKIIRSLQIVTMMQHSRISRD